MRHPVAVLVPTLPLPARAGLAVPARPVQRPGLVDPAAGVPSRAAFDRLAAEFGEGEFAPIVLAIRTTGDATDPANLAALYDYSRRLAADPRVTRVDEPRRRRPAPDPRPVPAPLRRPERPARPLSSPTALAATTKGDLTAFTIYTPYGPNRDEGRGPRRRPARTRPARSRRRPA